MPDLKDLLARLETPVRDAGAAIMAIHDGHVDIRSKDDGSPVTIADEQAQSILLAALTEIAPEIPVVSEEDPNSHGLKAPDTFFLVDPLDGTKEFLKRDGKGAFTVNVGLIHKGEPVLGIVYAPALNRYFSGVKGFGASENGKSIECRCAPKGGQISLVSASHPDDATQAWLDCQNIAEHRAVGSSLKFTLIAAGEADLYARFVPIMEWDTAAGDAVVRAAGGSVCNPDGTPFIYGKPGYRNSAFIARGKTPEV